MANAHYGACPRLANELQPWAIRLGRKSSEPRSGGAAKHADMWPIFLFAFAAAHVIVDHKPD